MKLAIIIEENDVDQLALFYTLPKVIDNIKLNPAYQLKVEIQMTNEIRENIANKYCKIIKRDASEYREFFGLPIKIQGETK